MAIYTYGQLVQLYATANGISPTSPEAITMGAVAMAESSGNPNAHNPSGASGLWQIMPSHTRDSGWNLGSNFYDPATNARMAYFVLHRQGYKAWTTYTSGAYKNYLGGSVPSGTSAENVGIPLPGWPSDGIGGSISGAAGDAIASALKAVLGPLVDVNFWRRVGIGLLGLFIVLVGLVMLLKQPIQNGVKTAAKVAAVAA